MKTSELTGALLDYWVAKAEGYEAEILKDDKGEFVVRTERFENGGHSRGPFFPSTNWLDGGPIIERERIVIAPNKQGWHWYAYTGGYWINESLMDYQIEEDGETGLIAAMRAYVASKFGDEVLDK